MADPFLAEIRILAFNFAPKNWAACDGQLLPINQNQALFSLLGTTYGGDGRTTFALPDLRDRVPIHFDQTHPLGQRAGSSSHVLTIAEMPAHTHALNGSVTPAETNNPTNALLAVVNNAYAPPANLVAMSPAAVTTIGANQAHENRQPFLALSFCIALAGLFPSRN